MSELFPGASDELLAMADVPVAAPKVETTQTFVAAVERADEARQDGSTFMSNFRGNKLIAGALVLSTGIASSPAWAASGGNSPERTPATTTTSASSPEQAATDSCGVAPNFEAQLANHDYAKPESLFPSLSSTEDSSKLVTTQQASETLKKQLAGDLHALAAYTAYVVEPRSSFHLPNVATIERYNQLYKSYAKNPQAESVQQDLSVACNSVEPELLEPTYNFASPTGQDMEVQAVRDGNANVQDVTMGKVQETDNLMGFKIKALSDNTSLSERQKAVLKQSENVLMISSKGTIIDIQTFGIGSIKISKNENAQKVKPTKGKHVVTFKPTKHGFVPVGTRTVENANGGSGESTGTQIHGHSGGGEGTNTGTDSKGNQGGGGDKAKQHEGTSGGGSNDTGKSKEKNPGSSTGDSVGSQEGDNHHSQAGPDNTPSGGSNTTGSSKESKPGSSTGTSTGGGGETGETPAEKPPVTPPTTPPKTPPTVPHETPPATPPETPPTTPPVTPPTTPPKTPPTVVKGADTGASAPAETDPFNPAPHNG